MLPRSPAVSFGVLKWLLAGNSLFIVGLSSPPSTSPILCAWGFVARLRLQKASLKTPDRSLQEHGGRLEDVQIDDLSLIVLHFGGFGVEVSTGDGEVGGGGFFGGP